MKSWLSQKVPMLFFQSWRTCVRSTTGGTSVPQSWPAILLKCPYGQQPVPVGSVIFNKKQWQQHICFQTLQSAARIPAEVSEISSLVRTRCVFSEGPARCGSCSTLCMERWFRGDIMNTLRALFWDQNPRGFQRPRLWSQRPWKKENVKISLYVYRG